MRLSRVRSLWSAVLTLTLTFALSSCNCGDPPGGGADTGSGTTGDSGVPACLTTGAACTAGAVPTCCSGLCVQADAGGSVCSEDRLCSQEGSSCTSATDCCSMNCTGGTCGGGLCAPLGSACAAPGDCCSGVCPSGSCAAIPNATCRSLGETCSSTTPQPTSDAGLDDAGAVTSEECCSGNCVGGRCSRASACSTAGDICYEALDCCNGTCNIAAAGGPGTCASSLTVPGGTGCTIGGELCNDSTGCCSRLCIDLGSGVATCVLGGGCRERGEICQDTSECCGFESSGVVCSKNSPTDLVGRCANPQACAPVGNCCGAFGDNCRQACCDGKKEVCRLDSQGLSRCFGGGDLANCPDGYDGLDPNCCIAAGQECQFRDQCCDFTPCIADDTGKYTCTAQTCVAAGAACTPGSSVCCNGLSCEPNGEIGFTCRVPGTSTGADAGTPATTYDDAGNPLPNDGGTGPTCKANQESCTAGSECCSNVCIGGVCASCKPDGQDCVAGGECCTGLCAAGKCVPPTTCVSQGGACSGTAECCPGTVCDISAGQATGTCNPGATCSSAGQACSTTQACCSSLKCDSAVTGNACAASDTRCVCRVVIN